ncbi:hypothetical protein Tco_1086432 [Tanacetum coccineum]
MEICPIKGYQVCRVSVTLGKSYKVEVLCIVDDIDECHILLGRPCQCEVNGKYDVKRNLYIFSWEGRRIAMVPPKVTLQVPKPKVKVEEKIVKAERKFIKDRVRHEKVFEVDEALDIENSRASYFQVRGIHVDETKDNAVWDWSSPKTLIGWIKKVPTLKVTEICKVPLAIGKHYNELVTCDVVDMKACHGRKTIAMLSLGVVSPKTKLENRTLVTLVASPKEFQAERKETGLKKEMVYGQRRIWDPGITWLKILKEHLEDKGNDEDMIQELAEEYMDHLERDKSKGTTKSNVTAKHK